MKDSVRICDDGHRGDITQTGHTVAVHLRNKVDCARALSAVDVSGW